MCFSSEDEREAISETVSKIVWGRVDAVEWWKNYRKQAELVERDRDAPAEPSHADHGEFTHRRPPWLIRYRAVLQDT